MSGETNNYIRKVAVIGGTGQVGGRVLSSLLATGKHSITAVTRQESKSTFPASVNVAKADYSSQESLTNALRGHDFVFISLSVAAPPDLHGRIVDAAVAAGIKWIMPNYFGFALTERDPNAFDDQIFTSFENPIKDVCKHQSEGVNFVALCCGFWYEFSLALWSMTYGFDFKEKKVTFYDDGKYKINTSTWELCGEAVAQLLSLPIQADGEQPAVSDWANKGLYISSFLISQRDMLDSVNRVMGTTDADWKIEYQGAKERYEEGVKEMMGGQRSGFAKAMYASTFIPNGRGDYQTGWTLDHENLGLKDEDLDTATKRAVDMVNAGFGPSSYSSAHH